MKKGTVTISHEHFKKSKLEYSNWMQAIFREAIQNSVDANASLINIDYYKMDNQKINLTFSDNGSGMSLDILLNILLTMGGSKKDNEDAIGGFGYAKSILFFAHDEYVIKTNDIILKGEGGNYSYTEGNPIVKGTEFNIIIENDYYHTNIENINQYLKEIIEFSCFNKVKFIINGEKNLYKSKNFNFELSSDLGEIKFSDNGYSNYSDLWIRINGLAMFKHSVYQREKQSSFLGVLDLNKSPLESLTANRDGLQYKYSSQLNSIFAKLSEEREKLTYNGMFNFILNEQDELEDIESIESIESIENIEEKNKSCESFIKELKEINTESEKAQEIFIDLELKKVFKDLSSQENKFQDFFNHSVKKINEDFYPNNFVISTEKSEDVEFSLYKKFFSELVKKNNVKMAIYWDTIINYLLQTSYIKEIIDYKSGRFYLGEHKVFKGFVFGNDTLLGANVYDRDKGYTLSINPKNSHVKLDFETIFDIAIHEISHFKINSHNEVFCFEEFLFRRCIQKEIKKHDIKKEIKEKLNLIKSS